jgi:hypothetical protein
MRTRYLLLSLAFHAALALFFFPPARAPSNPPEAVVVDLAPEPSPGASGAGGAGAPSRAVPNAPKPLPLSALAPVARAPLLPARPGEPRASAPDPFSPYAASEDVLESAPKEATGALAWVYRKAQLTIGYPQAFIRHDITGLAQARLVFGADGRLEPSLLHVRSGSPYLRVYVYRVLENTFRERVPANLVRWKGTFEVFCTVQFSFSETSTALTVTSPSPIVGNKLFFARRTFKSRAEKLKWELGPLHGMFPVPVVGMDMTWFYRKVRDARHPLRAQAEADDLAPYRKDPLFYD